MMKMFTSNMSWYGWENLDLTGFWSVSHFRSEPFVNGSWKHAYKGKELFAPESNVFFDTIKEIKKEKVIYSTENLLGSIRLFLGLIQFFVQGTFSPVITPENRSVSTTQAKSWTWEDPLFSFWLPARHVLLRQNLTVAQRQLLLKRIFPSPNH